MELNMVYVVSERPAVGLSGPMADPEVLSSEDTAKSRLALYASFWYQTQIFEKKFTFSPLFRGAFGSSSLTTIVAAAYGESFRQACAPGTKGRRA